MSRLLSLLASASFFCLACGRTPPQSVSIDPSFSEEQQATIVDVVDQWCESVGYCPELSVGGKAEGRIVAEHDYDPVTGDRIGGYERHGRAEGSGAFNDGDGTVFVNLDHIRMGDPSIFWMTLAHEFGHFGIDGHIKHGLMGSHQDVGMSCIDKHAVDEWCDQQGCEFKRPTCN